MAGYIIQGETLTAIADSIRAKTGTTEAITPADMPTAIEGITGGSGTSTDERVKYVTFMNGTTELYKQPVVAGDTCHDPYVDNNIDLPTKESTAQYDYTFNGWALTDGGSADSTALQNVTEGRTVYAAFKATARKYTITWYDDDGTTVLTTTQVAYGTVPSYAPTKDGVAFGGWTPTPVAVTGEASYTASWVSAIASGTCGDSLTWTLSADGLLAIRGSGAMPEGTNYNSPPWYSHMSSIKSVNIEHGATNIGGYMFYSAQNLTAITIPDSITSIGQYAFTNCLALTEVTIPTSVTSIAKKAFSGLGVTSITIPDGVTSIGEGVLSYCRSLTDITLPNGITTIPQEMFYYCKALRTYTIPNSVTNIAYSAFRECDALVSINIPDGVTEIGNYSFNGCGNLANITIGIGVKKIGNYAFQNCSALTSAVFYNQNGWYVSKQDNATSGTNVDVSNSSTNAKYLNNNYYSYHWYRT